MKNLSMFKVHESISKSTSVDESLTEFQAKIRVRIFEHSSTLILVWLAQNSVSIDILQVMLIDMYFNLTSN